MQIVDELHDIATARALSVAPVYGGVGLEKQAKRAARAHIVVATPGRLEDLLQRRSFVLDHVRVLVIDEADRMLDMGFKPAVDRIVAKTPRDRQTLFFSATLEAAAGKVARAYTHDARRHVHEPAIEDAGEVEHRFVHVEHTAKVAALIDELRAGERGRTPRLRAHQARGRPPRQAPAVEGRGVRRHAWQQVPGPAPARARTASPRGRWTPWSPQTLPLAASTSRRSLA